MLNSGTSLYGKDAVAQRGRIGVGEEAEKASHADGEMFGGRVPPGGKWRCVMLDLPARWKLKSTCSLA